MIERFQIQPYDLPLRRAWDSARGGFDRRRGWLIRVCSEGVTGFGDCAPLPAAGTETPAIAWETLMRMERLATARSVEELLDDLDAAPAPSPAARYALECALGDLLSQRQGLTLRHWLSPQASDAVPVNAMLGALGPGTAREIQAGCAQGFRVLKLKVGRDDPARELARLTALARQLPPGAGLRLDANGAWEPEDARRMIAGLADLPIESLEEPLRTPTAGLLAELQSLASFPLALDESLAAAGLAFDPSALGVRRLVLKPSVLGGLRRTQALARRAMAAGIEVVITSVVESAAGLWPTAQLAAAIGSAIPQGLATAAWLAQDLGAPPQPRDGWIRLSDRPGSGFMPAL